MIAVAGSFNGGERGMIKIIIFTGLIIMFLGITFLLLIKKYQGGWLLCLVLIMVINACFLGISIAENMVNNMTISDWQENIIYLEKEISAKQQQIKEAKQRILYLKEVSNEP